jgi:hypothetical protein
LPDGTIPERSETVENQSDLQRQRNRGVGIIVGLLRKPLVQIGFGLIFLFLLAGATYATHQAQLPPSQPIQFSHKRHVSLGIPCLYCHPGALRGPSPGLPTTAKCYGCHQQIVITTPEAPNPELDKVAAYGKNDEPIQWVPVAILPDFVYYSHRPHIAAGLNCENCHGEISQMTLARPQTMNMGWCLGCHRARFKNDPVMLTKLTDCVTCHK